MSRVTRLLPLARSKKKRASPSLLLGVGVKVVLLKRRDLRVIPAQSQELYINKIQSIKKMVINTKVFYFLNYHRHQDQATIMNTCCP